MKGAAAGKQRKVKSLKGEAKQVSTNLKGADLNKQGQWRKPSLHEGGAQVALEMKRKSTPIWNSNSKTSTSVLALEPQIYFLLILTFASNSDSLQFRL